ncbi:LINE-1 type transposase domain-containing 1 [Labeo rohita]|uniref:LINE-1 type transposase domain-containing 1 n=1 Tax=Labeo rohita TaxID=84645 RepID=A0A498NNP6_LABRO|nr:LINE-1 type transposase domain-containing 1 [Labeo rohita]
MPKPSKQNRPDHSRVFTGDSTVSSEANVNSEHAVSHESSLPDFSHGALLKHIADVVAEEGRHTQKMMNESFAKLESGLDIKVDSIIKRIGEIAAATESLSSCVTETETRISAVEEDIASLQKKLFALENLNTTLAEKVTDLEGRTRRDNIRILNLRESVEGSDPLQFFESFLPKPLDLPVKCIEIDRAHRGLGTPTDGRPRPVILKIHRSRDVTTILSAARRKGQLHYEGQPLCIAPDISPAVRAARRAFNTVCAELIKKGIRFQMNFPAVLVFKVEGTQKTFRDPKDAKTYIDSNV